MNFHATVDELIDRDHLTVEDAISQAAHWMDHPSEHTVRGGHCTLCEEESAELWPWASRERLCPRCVDIQLDLLAKAVAEAMPDAGPVMVTA